ncbi:hypothetical protein [Pseudomonas phage PPAY]|nr:hypothetical protein [Pseudomonas phage PPAY]UCW44415.1 hypothetical protein [Pseudomonas phage PPAT]
MYEVYREYETGLKKIVNYASKKEAEEFVQLLVRDRKRAGLPDATYEIKYVKPDYIYVVEGDGKYLLTTKSRQSARRYVSMVKKFGADINKKYTITQINLNNVEGKIVR